MSGLLVTGSSCSGVSVAASDCCGLQGGVVISMGSVVGECGSGDLERLLDLWYQADGLGRLRRL